MTGARRPKPPDFEHSLALLEELVQRLEQGDLPLEEALSTFERGVALTRECQTALQAAQQKVEILLKASGEVAPQPFAALDPEAPDEDDGLTGSP
jgi:exodeoxyribonuclease VII small subunit